MSFEIVPIHRVSRIRRGPDEATIVSSPILNFGRLALEKYKLNLPKFWHIYFDLDNLRIGFKPRSKQDKNTKSLTLQYLNAHFHLKAFFNYYSLNLADFKRKVYRISKENDMIIVDLKEPIGEL